MTNFERFFPWGVVLAALVYVVAMMFPPPDEGAMRLHDFAALPVV